MNPSNTVCVGQEGPANALALNKDCTQVVIAGRNVFKVFSCGEDEFSEVCNLRVGKNLNLNFSSIDVAWSAIEENTLATAATNGAVVVWNLGRSGRSKQEHVFSDHKRTVNKVSFHLTEPAILISGSQDGMMKCFDLRMKEVTKTFISNCESVRDVQFSPGNPQQFAAVSENGSAQVWDIRRHERPLHQFTAHSGPVFACDWHPDQPWLATASRDKTIKVWDMQAKPTLEHTIYTIASVGHVKWRPQKKYQISSCALVLDCAVHVWDVRRPHVPLATFAEHRDVTTALAWQRADAFLSTSRDCTLYRHHWGTAAHPVLWAPPQAVAVAARGELAQAVPRAPLPAPAPAPATSAPAPPPPPALGRKQPTAGSLAPAAQATLERLFPGGGAGGGVTRWRAPESPLPRAAQQYRLRGGSVGELAKHNASVARSQQRHLVAHVWDVVAVLYRASEAAPRVAPPPPPPRAPPPRPPAAPNEYSAVEEEPPEEMSEWTEFHNNGVLGLPTHSIYIPPAKFAKLGDDDSPGWVSAASAHYVDVDAADWTLPEEAFPPGQAHQAHHAAQNAHAHALPHDDSQDTAKAVTEELKNRKGYLTVKAQVVCDADLRLMNVDACWPGSADNATIFDNSQLKGGSNTSSASPGGSSGDSTQNAFTLRPSLSQDSSSGGGGGGGGAAGADSESGEGGLSLAAVPPRAPPAPAPLLAQALKQHAELGDVQTAVSVLIVLNENRSELFPFIEEALQEQWLLAYVELLQRHKLYNIAIEVIGLAWLGSVWSISQQSTVVAVVCARCGRRARPARPAPPVCDTCRQRDTCAVCKQVVRGLYAWCQGCAHGGHLHHMQRWMASRRLCPAGCGHRCQLP